MSTALNDQPVLSTFDLPDAKREHGLLSVLTDISGPDPQWIYSGLDVETICGGVGTSTAFCLGDTEQVEDKAPFANEWPHLSPFAVYALHECSSIGKPRDERASDAMSALLLGEQTALEGRFATLALADDELSTANAASLEEALFTAEEVPGFDSGRVIHLTPGNALRLSEYLRYDDGRLTTKIGTPVVAGLGYVGPLDGVLVTGTVLGASGEAFTTETILDRFTNLLSVLAEKPWALGYACGATQITATP